MFGASFDSVEANRAFAEKHGFTFPLLSDPTREAGAAYGTLRPPDHPGASVARRLTYLIAPDGTIARAWRVTDTSGHADEVLAALRELTG